MDPRTIQAAERVIAQGHRRAMAAAMETAIAVAAAMEAQAARAAATEQDDIMGPQGAADQADGAGERR